MSPDNPTDSTSDLDLIRQVRRGENAGYQKLYERHSTAARNLARQLSSDPSRADDLVSEAFTKVLQAIRADGGPAHAFRTYLLTTLRNVAYEQGRRDKRITWVDDNAVFESAVFEQGEMVADSASVAPERTLITAAYRLLPERWRIVLWYTEVEGYEPAAIAPIMGMTPNGVAALSYRAREGLRQAYLEAHVATVDAKPAANLCHASVNRLGAWARKGLSRRERSQLELHLDKCVRCRALAAELTEINTALPAIVAVAVLGAAGAGYAAAAPAATGAAAGAIASATSKGGQLLGAAASSFAVAVATVVGLSTGMESAAEADNTIRFVPQTPTAPTPTTPAISTSSATTVPAEPAQASTSPSRRTTRSTPPRPSTSATKPPYQWGFTANAWKKFFAWTTVRIAVPDDAPQVTPVTIEITPPPFTLMRAPNCVQQGGTFRCVGHAGGGRVMALDVEITAAWPLEPEGMRVTLTAGTQVVTKTVRVP